MIIISFINWICGILSGTHLNFTFDGSVFNAISGAIDFISWVLPMDTILFCFTITIATMAWRLIVSILRTIWSIIPLP